MATQKVLVLDPTTNLPKELTPNTTSAGAADAGKIPALNSSGQIDATMIPGAATLSLATSENLAAGAVVNIDSTGKVRNANATDATKPGVAFVKTASTSPANNNVYFAGDLVSGLTGLTPGAPVYLSAASAGGATSTAPSAAGNLVQQLGTAISATEFIFDPTPGIIHG